MTTAEFQADLNTLVGIALLSKSCPACIARALVLAAEVIVNLEKLDDATLQRHGIHAPIQPATPAAPLLPEDSLVRH